jgi:hypothetical protein
MPATHTPYATGGRGTSSAWLADSVGSDLPLKSSPGSCQRINRNIFVDVYRLRVLAQVIQAREASRTMTLERSLASMFPTKESAFKCTCAEESNEKLPNVSSQMFAPREAQIARRIIDAVEPLRLLFLIRFRAISIHTLVVRSSVVMTFSVRIVHVHIFRATSGLPRMLRVFSMWDVVLVYAFWYLHGLGKWRCR